ncbi:MAG TPA: hypothetical protein VF283_18940 [Bryobacteraceae bacterium]
MGRFIAAFLLAAALLLADGGTLQLQKQSEGLLITLFSSPVPLRAGTGDLSVMVQDAKDHSPILDAHVLVHVARKVNGEIREVALPATHAKASNKMLYAADVPFDAAGDWRATVDVASNGKTASVSGPLRVLPKQPPILAYWPFFLVIPVLIVLFTLNRWLKRRRQIGSAPPLK